MSVSMTLLDPTSERAPVARALTPRPSSLDGLAVALLDISKARAATCCWTGWPSC